MNNRKSQEALLQRSKTADQVLQCLMDWIMDGTLQMGEKLQTERISAALGVSRMPVREALNVLVRKGIAVSEPYVGTRLIELTTDEIVEIYHLRCLLESDAAYNACLNITPDTLERVKQIHREYQDILLNTSLNAQAIHLKNREFHFAIYQASGMNRLCSMIEELWDTLSFFKMLYGETLLEDEEGRRRMIAEHRSYIDCLETKAADRLREITCRNITDKLRRYQRANDNVED